MSDPQNNPLSPQPFDHPRFWALRSFDRTDNRFEMQIKAAIDSANVALRGLLLLNGAAAIALLAFLSNVLQGDHPNDVAKQIVSQVAHSLMFFAAGAGASVVAACFAYFVNRAYGVQAQSLQYNFEYPFVRDTPKSNRWQRWGDTLTLLALVAAGISLLAFGAGVWKLWPS